jgi:hypothetical protein
LLVVGDGQLLVEYPPTISVLTLANHLKGMSGRMLRKEFPELAARGAHLWTPNYFAASTGGAPIERLMGYMGEAQEKPSRRTGFVSQNSHRSKSPPTKAGGREFQRLNRLGLSPDPAGRGCLDR